MSFTLLLVAAGLAHAPAPVAINNEPDQVDVAYAELAQGRTNEAIEKIEANVSLNSSDPGRLINLGTAYARTGQTDEARRLYRSALVSDPIELELADGTWVDSHNAARMALATLNDSATFAMR